MRRSDYKQILNHSLITAVLERANRYMSDPVVPLLIAVVFGSILRIYPVIGRHFPINDGGFWYVVSHIIGEHSGYLPEFIPFNGHSVPFTYPPLAGYVIWCLSSLAKLDVLILLTWLPASISIMSIVAFWIFARRLYSRNYTVSIATIVFSLLPTGYRWFIMGGGVPRCLGLVFMLLGWSALLAEVPAKWMKVVAGMLVGLAILSHPVSGFTAVLGSVILLVLYSRSRSNIIFVLAGCGALTLPWIVVVIHRFGIGPYIAGYRSGNQSFLSSLSFFSNIDSFGVLKFGTAICILGILGATKKFPDSFAVVLFVTMGILLTRSMGSDIGVVPTALLIAQGMTIVSRGGIGVEEAMKNDQCISARAICLQVATVFFLFSESARFSEVISHQTMNEEEFAELRRISTNPDIPGQLLVATQHVMVGDAVGEWLVSFSDKKSLLLHQLSEWNGEFGKLVEAQYKVEDCCKSPEAACAKELNNMVPSGVLLIHKPSCNLLHQYLSREGMTKVLVEGSRFTVISKTSA